MNMKRILATTGLTVALVLPGGAAMADDGGLQMEWPWTPTPTLCLSDGGTLVPCDSSPEDPTTDPAGLGIIGEVVVPELVGTDGSGIIGEVVVSGFGDIGTGIEDPVLPGPGDLAPGGNGPDDPTFPGPGDLAPGGNGPDDPGGGAPDDGTDEPATPVDETEDAAVETTTTTIPETTTTVADEGTDQAATALADDRTDAGMSPIVAAGIGAAAVAALAGALALGLGLGRRQAF